MDEAFRADAFCKKSGHCLRKAVPCKRIGMAVVGLEVPHTHVHLIPLNEMDAFSK
jgi:histidine triad (HIT) family protein